MKIIFEIFPKRYSKNAGRCPAFPLLSEIELREDGAIALDVLVAKIRQKAAAMADHFQQTATGMMILLVLLQVLGQVRNPRSQNGDLNLRRSGVPFVNGVLLNQCCFLFFGQHKYLPPVLKFSGDEARVGVLAPRVTEHDDTKGIIAYGERIVKKGNEKFYAMKSPGGGACRGFGVAFVLYGAGIRRRSSAR